MAGSVIGDRFRLRQGFLLRYLLRRGYVGQESYGGQDDGQGTEGGGMGCFLGGHLGLVEAVMSES